MAKEGILLESGTNEVEILEFVLAGQAFGVNVLKIQAIEQYDSERITTIQLAHPSVVGTLLFRDSCITLVDLSREMWDENGLTMPVEEDSLTEAENETEAIADIVSEEMNSVEQPEVEAITVIDAEDDEKKLVLVMEFNDLKTAFIVDGVNRIHRASWEDISPISPFLATNDTKFTGSIQIEDREILIVDLEKIVAEILPREQLSHSVIRDTSHPNFRARSTVKVLLAEDSALIRERVTEELKKGNYTDVTSFGNGLDCYRYIGKKISEANAEDKPISDYLNAVISDIEMPQMDGLTLCRNIKETTATGEVPVIIFSSLINDQIAQKCKDVNSNAYISKPQFAELVNLLDSLCLENNENT